MRACRRTAPTKGERRLACSNIGDRIHKRLLSNFDSDSEFPHQILSKGKHSASRSGPIVSDACSCLFHTEMTTAAQNTKRNELPHASNRPFSNPSSSHSGSFFWRLQLRGRSALAPQRGSVPVVGECSCKNGILPSESTPSLFWLPV